jgi:hypothetical protein
MQNPDLYKDFKANGAPRWDNDVNETAPYTFITDTGGNLFGSSKYKTGRITSKYGTDFEIIEFSGLPTVGKPANASIRKASGSTPLHSLQIVKIDNGKLWMLFKESAGAPERKVVQ